MIKKDFYALYIGEDHSIILHIKNKKKDIFIEDYQEIDTDDLEKNISTIKDELICVVSTQDTINEIVELQKNIKKDSIIKTLILKRLKDRIGKNEVIINYKQIDINDFDDTIKYQVDGVYKKELEDKLEIIPNWDKIKTITNDKFALLNITNQCYDAKKFGAYIVANTFGSKLLILAVNEEEVILFERTSIVNAENKELLFSTLVNEVSQTIAYCKNQFREVEFHTVLLSGSMAHSDTIAEQIFLSSDLSVAVLYPNSFIKNTHYDDVQKYIISLGGIFTEKTQQYLPNKYLSLKQFKVANYIVYILTFSFFIITSFLVSKAFINYQVELDQYKKSKQILLDMVAKTNKFSTKELKTIYNHLNIAKEYLYNHPLDIALKLKPLIELIKPDELFYEQDDKLHYKFIFKKQFNSLNELYHFQKDFFTRFDKINKEKDFEILKKTDYKELLFNIEINESKKNKQSSPKRRKK